MSVKVADVCRCGLRQYLGISRIENQKSESGDDRFMKLKTVNQVKKAIAQLGTPKTRRNKLRSIPGTEVLVSQVVAEEESESMKTVCRRVGEDDCLSRSIALSPEAQTHDFQFFFPPVILGRFRRCSARQRPIRTA